MSQTALEFEYDRAWEDALRHGEIACCSVCGRLFMQRELLDKNEPELCCSCYVKTIDYRKYKDNMGSVLVGKLEAAIDGLNIGNYTPDRFIAFVKEQVALYNISKIMV